MFTVRFMLMFTLSLQIQRLIQNAAVNETRNPWLTDDLVGHLQGDLTQFNSLIEDTVRVVSGVEEAVRRLKARENCSPYPSCLLDKPDFRKRLLDNHTPAQPANGLDVIQYIMADPVADYTPLKVTYTIWLFVTYAQFESL